MEKRYTALRMICSFISFISIVVVIGGVGISLFFIMQFGVDVTTKMLAIGGIVASFVVGIIVYAYAEIIHCFMDIEENTRRSANILSHSEKLES